MRENFAVRFEEKGLHYFDKWQRITLEKHFVEKSSGLIRQLVCLSRLTTSFIQKVVFYYSKGTGMEIFLEFIPDLNRVNIFNLTEMEKQRFFFQAFALFQHLKRYRLSVVDYYHPVFFHGGHFVFPLQWKAPNKFNWDIKEFLSLFPKISNHQQKLSDSVCLNTGNRVEEHAFHEDSYFLYQISDSLSRILSLINQSSEKNLYIHWQCANVWKKNLLINGLHIYCHQEDIFFLYLDLSDFSLIEGFSQMSRVSNKADMSHLLFAFEMMISSHGYKKAVLFLENVYRTEDIQTFQFIRNQAKFVFLVLITCSRSASFSPDVTIYENSHNLLKKTFCVAANHQLVKKKSREIMPNHRLFSILRTKFPEADLNRIVSTDEWKLMQLYNDLRPEKTSDFLRSLDLDADRMDIHASQDKIIKILSLVKKQIGLDSFLLFYYLEVGDVDRLLGFLKQKKSIRNICKSFIYYSEEWFFERIYAWEKDSELVHEFLRFLLMSHQNRWVDCLLQAKVSKNSTVWNIAKGFLLIWDLQFHRLPGVFLKIREISQSWRDEALFLKAIQTLIQGSNPKRITRVMKIDNPYYFHLFILIAAYWRMQTGQFKQLEDCLEKSRFFFQLNGYVYEEIWANEIQGKFLEFKGGYYSAKGIYHHGYFCSQMYNYLSLQASIAARLGEFYFQSDCLSAAERWFEKAIHFYSDLNHQERALLIQLKLSSLLLAKGNWQKVESILTECLYYLHTNSMYSIRGKIYLTLARLEYLRFRFSNSFKWLQKIVSQHGRRIDAEEVLEWYMLCMKIGLHIQRDIPQRPSNLVFFTNDQRIEYEILCRLVSKKTSSNPYRNWMYWLEQIRSNLRRLEIAMLIGRISGDTESINTAEKISKELADKTDQYSVFEFQQFLFELQGNKRKISALERKKFFTMMDFFSQRKRKMPWQILLIRKKLNHWDCPSKNLSLSSSTSKEQAPQEFLKICQIDLKKEHDIYLLGLVLMSGEHSVLTIVDPELPTSILAFFLSEKKDSSEIGYSRNELEILFKDQAIVRYAYPYTRIIRNRINDTHHAILILAFDSDSTGSKQKCFESKVALKQLTDRLQNYFNQEYWIQSKLGFIIGESTAIRHMKEQIVQAARVDFSLLITGESGSGKELVAQSVHILSQRSSKPFVAMNAGAIPHELIEAELFGYRKGAFTGAVDHRIGLFEEANHGTLFLDEITDLPLNLQGKLLRVLQEGEIRRLGENKTLSIDVRLISATNRNIQELIEKGQFREDLYFRLQDIQIEVPPLRNRREDIPLLIRHFLKKHQKWDIAPELFDHCLESFLLKDFPGNVRELESEVKKAITFGVNSLSLVSSPFLSVSWKSAEDQFKRSFLHQKLEENNWNRVQTARKLKISRMSLYNLMKRLGLEKR